MGGQYSLPFTTAVAISRDMSNPLVFSEETLWDPYVRELALRVEIEEHGSGPEVIIDVDGESHVIEVGDFPGSLRHPLSFDEVCHKFRRYTQTVVELKRREKILKLVEHLEQISDMALLARLLQARNNSTACREVRPPALATHPRRLYTQSWSAASGRCR